MKGYTRTPIELASDCYEIIQKNMDKSLVIGFPFRPKGKKRSDTIFDEIYATKNVNGFSEMKDEEFIICMIEYIIKEFIDRFVDTEPPLKNQLKIKASKPLIKYTYKLYYQEGKIYHVKKMHSFMGREMIIYSVPKITNDQVYKSLPEKITRDYEMNYTCYFYSKI